MKILEKIIDKRLREIMEEDQMQFGFRPWRGTTDTIFVLRQIQEILKGQKMLYHTFINLEKTWGAVVAR